MTPFTRKIGSYRGLLTLSFGLHGSQRLVYFGLMVSLVLFLANHIHLDIHQAYALYGIYLTFIYSLSLLGGYIADRFIGAHRSILYGAVLIITGCLILSFGNIFDYKIGLAATICGVGFFKSSTPGLLGKLYKKHDAIKENGFTLFYAGMNFGAIIGPITLGLASTLLNWSAGFLICSALMLAALIFYLFQYASFAKLDTHSLSNHGGLLKWIVQFFCLIVIGILLASVTLILSFPQMYRWVILVFIVVTTIAILRLLQKEGLQARKKLLVLILINIINMCFFIAELQMGGSLTIFINQQINRTLFGWHIPTELLTALLPIFVAAGIFTMAPYFIRLGKVQIHKRLFIRMLLGMILGSISFAIFSLTALPFHHHNSTLHLGLIGVIVAYFFLGSGEINIGPMINAATTYLAPKSLQSTFMGLYYLFVALAGYIASSISNLTTSGISSGSHHTMRYSLIFIAISGALLGVGIITCLCYPLLKRGIQQ